MANHQRFWRKIHRILCASCRYDKNPVGQCPRDTHAELSRILVAAIERDAVARSQP